MNDFYPIFWGFGGRVQDENGTMIFLQADMLAIAEAALGEIVGMQGSLAPSPGALKNFEAPTSLRQAFLRGEALFMINWNTRLYDLQAMLSSPEWQGRAAIKSPRPDSAWGRFLPRADAPEDILISVPLGGASIDLP